MLSRLVLGFVLLLGLVVPAAMATAGPVLPEKPGLVAGPTGLVTEIIDADTVFVRTKGGDRLEVRLVGVQAPKLPLGRKNFKSWPLAEEAAAALKKGLQGQTVKLFFGTTRNDRHGRTLAHLVRSDDGTWVQGWLVSQGWARVYSFSDNRLLVTDLLALEQIARKARKGIWDHPAYQLRQSDFVARNLSRFEGRFELVEGRIVDVADQKRRTYLNFGADWRDDFTVVIEAKDRKRFNDEGLNLKDLAGRHVRVRGWIYRRNGPMIRITHPEQMEVLDK